MKHFRFCLFYAAVSLLLFGCAPVSLIQSSRQVAKYNINETTDLVGDTSKSVHGEEDVLYSISNDQQNLYVTLMVADPKTQAKFLHNGFTLWVDTTGNRKETLGIAYPLQSKGHRMQQSDYEKKDGEQEDVPNYEDKSSQIEMKRRRILTMLDMNLLGYDGKKPVRVPTVSNSMGIRVGLLVDSNGALQYHAIIPFAAMHYHPALHTGKKAKPLTLALTTNKEESRPAGEKGSHGGGMGEGGGMGGGGMGGMGGGGMRGGGHGGGEGSSQMDPANDPVEVWIHVKLAAY